MLKLTRGEVIETGLNLAARPDLVADARLWLNLFLEKIYYNQDYNWLVKSVRDLAVVQGGALPADYRAAKSATILQEGKELDLVVVDNEAEWDAIRSSSGLTRGVPRHVYVDHLNRLYYFTGEQVGNLVWNLKYYHMPSIPSHLETDNDNLIPYWEQPTEILVDYIKSKAMEYNDDMRQEKAMAQTKTDLTEAKMNQHDRRGGRSRIPWGKSFKRRWGRGSGGGGIVGDG